MDLEIEDGIEVAITIDISQPRGERRGTGGTETDAARIDRHGIEDIRPQHRDTNQRLAWDVQPMGELSWIDVDAGWRQRRVVRQHRDRPAGTRVTRTRLVGGQNIWPVVTVDVCDCNRLGAERSRQVSDSGLKRAIAVPR